MFCTKCGQKLDEGATFCTRCGNRTQGVSQQQPQQPQQQPQQPPPAAWPQGQQGYPGYGQGYPVQKKKKTGLIIGLSVGGAALIIAVVLLLILLPKGDNSGIVGTWYDASGYSGTINFRANGTFETNTMGIAMSGTYTFDKESNTGKISIEYYGASTESDFTLDGDSLNIEGTLYTRNYVEQYDYGDLLDGLDMNDLLN